MSVTILDLPPKGMAGAPIAPSAESEIYNIAEKYLGSGSGEAHFELAPDFLKKFRGQKPKFGFNGLGEFVFYRTYSRLKKNGSKETFLDVLKRVVEGCYEIQRRHCNFLHIPWNYDKAQTSAQEMFQRMWYFKFLPPGRGLWMMGTKFMWERGSAALNNCGFVSTSDLSESDPAEPFCFLMDMSMLGVGVGFDTKGAGKIHIYQPNHDIIRSYKINDSREGWVDSIRHLIRSYTVACKEGIVEFDYSEIRKEGSDIKGFGGKSSGPGILMELHALVRAHLESRIGQTLNSVDITDLMNYIGSCVVAGNVRRTAEIAFGDADDEAYCSMKNATKTLKPEDMEAWWAVTTEIYKAKRNYATFADFDGKGIPEDRLLPAIHTWNALNHHRWASNNSIFAKLGMDYKSVGQQIGVNGEPGIIWLNNVRDYGRMVDGLQPGIDGRVMGANPCFSGDMRLLTAGGYVTMRELWEQGGYQEFTGVTNENALPKYGRLAIVNKRGVVTATNVYRTSERSNLFRVKLSDGSWIDATENHKFITLALTGSVWAELRKPLSALQVGDRIPAARVVHFANSETPARAAYAELAGWCIGDGSLSPKADGQVRAMCTCYETDIETVLPRLQGLMEQVYAAYNSSSDQSPAYEPWRRPHGDDGFSHEEQTIGSNVLGRLLREDGIVSGDKHRVPASIWAESGETVAAFIRGLASADGGVQVNETKKCISVRIGQVNRSLLADVRLLLSQFGIASSVHKRQDAYVREMCDGRGGKKSYDCQTRYELIISGGKNVRKFIDKVGFIQPWKMELAKLWLTNHHGSNNSESAGNYSKVVSIEFLRSDETFCLTEPGDNAVIVEGHHVGQCMEQSLESYELCNLVETFPSNHDDADDYMRTLKFAYLYAKTVTLLPTHNRRTNQVTLRNRRIGLSQSGIVESFAKFGRRAVLKDFCDAGYNEIRRWDQIYSDWLCVPKSIKVTSVKPSGTVSLVVGVSPGIHHPEAGTYWRLVRVAKDSILVKILRDAGFKIEPVLSDPDRTVVVYFGVKGESGVRPVGEVSIWEQMQNAVDYQRYWADNQVSCTVKFKPHESQDIARVLEVFEDQLKGISFLPHEDHGYAQAPYTPCAPEEVQKYNSQLGSADYSEYLYEAVGSMGCDNDKCVLPV